MALTARQAAFVREYLKDGDSTQAAVRSGCSRRGARQMGRRLRSDPEVDQAIRAAREAAEPAGRDFVLRELVRIVRAEGEESPEANRRCANKLKALELLGRHLDLFTPSPGPEEGELVEIRLSPEAEELAR